MQVLFNRGPGQFVTQRPRDAISLRPLAKVYCARKIWLVPAAGRGGLSRLAITVPSTVHVPRSALVVMLRFESTAIYTFFAPAKAGRKWTVSLTVWVSGPPK